MTVDFKYGVGDVVMIKALSMQGHVDAMSVDRLGLMYRVVWWWECKRNTEWLYDWEIERPKE